MGGRLEKFERTEERALNPDKARKLLKQTCEGSKWHILETTGIKSIKRRNGRSHTIRYEVTARLEGQEVRRLYFVGKIYRGHKGEHTFNRLQYLYDSSPKRVTFPEPVGYNGRHRFLLMSSLNGAILTELLKRPSARLHLEQVAAALADFHNVDTGGTGGGRESGMLWPTHDARAEEEVLTAALARVKQSELPASLQEGYEEVFGTVQRNLAGGEPSAHCIIHRDLYARQVVYDQGRIGLVDLDEVSLGEAELDLGNFIAHLQLADLHRTGHLGPSALQAEILTQAYETFRPFSVARLTTYHAASLLRLASIPRLGRPAISILEWKDLAANLIDLAGCLVEEKPGSLSD